MGHGLRCTWEQRIGDDWRLMASDRPTQAYDFGWWDGRPQHYLARRPEFVGPGTVSKFLTTGDPASVSAHATQFLRRPIRFEAA